MSNILIISAVFSPEPIVSAKLSEDLALTLSTLHKVSVIAPKPTRPYGFEFNTVPRKESFHLINLDSYTCPESNLIGRLRESYSFGIACKKYILENHTSIDLIYMNSWPIFSQFSIIKIAKKYNIKVVTHVQDVYPESLSNKMPRAGAVLNFIFLPIDKFVLKNSNKIIAISTNMKNYLVKTRNLTESKIKVVQNWQNEEDFNKYEKSMDITSLENNLFTFMYLGNIGPVAGIDFLLESFDRAALKNCRLVIAGSGSMKNTLQEKVKLKEISGIEFWDVPNGKVPEIQSKADVMLLPIKKGAAASSIPSKLPAYMFSKKPIIACVDRYSDTARAINAADCGWVLEPENTNVLSEKIKSIYALSKNKLIEKGNNGFDYAMENLSKKNNLKTLTSLILNTLSVNQK